MTSREHRAGPALVVVCLAGLMGIAACGAPTQSQSQNPTQSQTSSRQQSATSSSGTSAGTSAGAPAAALCAAVNDFQAAAANLTKLDASSGVDGVKAALRNLETAANDLANAAQSQFGPQVAALRQALSSLHTTIGSLSDQSSVSAKLGAITTSVSAVEQAASHIVDGARGSCPSVSATPLPTQS
jgi:ABC-type glycerol-3-phosphate transport system substrate-binding protein